jgi:hypothetical protein
VSKNLARSSVILRRQQYSEPIKLENLRT